MQPNGNAIVIEAEPINECPTCGQPRVLRDHVIHIDPDRALKIVAA
ncbi:hypothetical protein FRC0414_00275 [Corynebacterium diphtheriae]|nr:hypothetical protein [Corynebacterium diphtheriae]MBG9343449.1 hypothetical protein [Corynebacterium diphtheriae]CAB0889831.1 hypothetical protein FRC0414_00275 [Corynebacterium diphtheriae]